MYEIFEKLLKERNLTAYKVAKATGINNQTFSAWKNGVYTPKHDKLEKIAGYFGVSVAYLMGVTDVPDEEFTVEAAQERLAEIRKEKEAIKKQIEELNKEKERINQRLNENKQMLDVLYKLKNLTPEQRRVIEALLDQINK